MSVQTHNTAETITIVTPDSTRAVVLRGVGRLDTCIASGLWMHGRGLWMSTSSSSDAATPRSATRLALHARCSTNASVIYIQNQIQNQIQKEEQKSVFDYMGGKLRRRTEVIAY